MISKIVHKSKPITLVGAGDVDTAILKRVISYAPTLVAADGGAVHIRDLGLMPDAVIGDMDSLSGNLKAELPKTILHPIDEQDSTDFEKCLMRIKAPAIVGLGFLGGRLDHQLAAFHGLVRFPKQRCILLGPNELVFLCPPAIDIPLNVGTPVSLFPLGAVTGRLQGLKWSFDMLDFAPGQRIGTSNEAAGAIHLEMSAPYMLCILPASCFEIVLAALTAQTD